MAALSGLAHFCGIASWPAILFILWIRDKRAFYFSFVIAILYMFFYMQDIQTDMDLAALNSSAAVRETTTNWLSILLNACLDNGKFIILYFGSPLSRTSPFFGGFLALTAILYLLLSAIQCLRWRNTQPFQLFCLAIGLAMIFIALTTSLGRQILRNATSERYQPVVMLF